MVDGNVFVPLSPPTSPRMSAYSTTPADSDWHTTDIKSLDVSSAHAEGDMALLQAEVGGHNFDLKRPGLSTHKSMPYGLNGKYHTISAGSPTRERISISNIDEVDSGDLPTVTFGGSAPASPVSRMTPPSPNDTNLGEDTKVQGDEIITEDKDDLLDDVSNEEEKRPMTAAEIRAQKRKMKRFRLTHNQTRFLMSEFARQAHPDAAHRERLAREIPGLSPRQVQVWFQNRRAKLKRLTSDDRERMMRSRALPDDFDMAQALHAPFGAGHPLANGLTSPGYSPAYQEGNMMRPLSIDTLRRGPVDAHISPTGISPAFGGFAFTPPQSATDTLSPVSTHEGSPFGFPPAPLDTSPRTSNPFSASVSAAPQYAAHHSIPPRLSIHADRLARSRADSLSSPLRASMSYTHGHDHMNGHPDSGNQMPYGIGYSYSPVPGFQASSASRMRSFSNSVPRRIELSTHYTPSRNANTPQTAGFPAYTSSPLVGPGNFGMPQLSAPHHLTSFQSSYLRNDSTASEQYPGAGAILGEVVENNSQDNDDHADHHITHAY